MTHEFIAYSDREALVIALAGRLASDLRGQLSRQDRVALALPGGTSPGPVFDDLCGVDLAWDRVDVLLTDERWVSEDSPRSNTRLLRERLMVDKAAAAHLLPLYRDDMDCDAAAEALADRIEPVLPLGVVLMGMGTDRHTASIFPGADRLDEALSPRAPTLVPMRAPGADEPRVTLSAQVLNGALCKHVLIFGRDKREALEGARGLKSTDAPINAVLDGATVHWAE
ncbi:6-phosphogluconolactonase [Citreimonas salinaria]|uniref:6-phosphogluconolactonase n=1 Tax=Citreimonas salinaria TaxID=321339 RepID=A0A1H3G640_9RHOB|nr:6-phosphogluconolactonase [Citreimonas salinaria]SDX98520.1 6-phosphogluconolactonase [Citreimonas salinaria]